MIRMVDNGKNASYIFFAFTQAGYSTYTTAVFYIGMLPTPNCTYPNDSPCTDRPSTSATHTTPCSRDFIPMVRVLCTLSIEHWAISYPLPYGDQHNSKARFIPDSLCNANFNASNRKMVCVPIVVSPKFASYSHSQEV